jgi:Gas vesicle protein G
MLIADDILMFPVNGVLWIFNEIYNAAEQELRSESDAITAQLQQLYAMLETGKITEIEFDRREAELLDRLDAIQEQGAIIDDDE